MKIKIRLIGTLLLLCPFLSWGQTNTAIASGAWETAANWSLGHVPLNTENVAVPSPYSMTVNANGDVCLSLTISSGATVTVTGPWNLSIAGNFSNAGTYTSTNVFSSLTFNASSNSVVSGSGSYAIHGTIILDMGSTSTSLDIQSSPFSFALSGSFNLIQGTWIMDNPGTIANCYTNTTSQLIIPNTVVIQSNQGIMYLCNYGTENNILLEGGLYMNGGSVFVGADQGYNAGIDFQYHVVGGVSPSLTVASGNLYIFAGFNWLTLNDYINFNMSGGTIYCACSYGNTNGGYSDSATFCLQDVFGGQTVMTGGTIVLQDADNSPSENDLDMGGANVAATLYSVTGGTVKFGYLNTQSGSSFFGITPHPTTNYPNFDFESGSAKSASPYFSSSTINILSLYINPNMTWDATSFNNNVNFTGYSGVFTLNDQGTFNPGSGTYTFNGSVPQIMTGNQTIPFNNLTIDNSSGVTMTTPANVSGSFILTNGLLNTTTTNILTLLAGATSSSGTISSYVNGPMAKTGNTAFVFPIGGSGRFMPLGVSAPATSTNTISTYYTHATPINPTSVNAPLTNVSLLEYWTMSETVPTDVVDVTLYWQNGPLSGIYNYNNTLQVADYIGAAWNDLGQSAITGTYPTAGSVTAASTITNFTNLPVTFGSTDANINPLPITLTSFTANYTEENNSVLAQWTVATQLNNKKFIVEKTLDGTNYQEVATVAGAGTTPFTMYYSAIDPTPSPGLSYYRLKQIDMDGNPTVFSPVAIFIQNGQSDNSINLYPNPVSSIATLTYISTDENNLSGDIIDASGRTVSSFAFNNVHTGENNFFLTTSGLDPGIYFLRIDGGQKLSVVKFIKQ